MRAISCCANTFRVLSRAAAKAAGARLREMRLLSPAGNWSARAQLCERCPLRVISRGVSYCGQPLMQRVAREESIDGCGCPTISKARAPGEHCPLDARNRPAESSSGHCTCKWCDITGN